MKMLKKSLMILFISVILLMAINSINAQDINNTDDFRNSELGDAEISVKTFTDLYNEINSTGEGSTVELDGGYRFDSIIDSESFVDGVPISKNISLIGKNNAFLDGNFLASGLNISSNCNVVIKNIIFKNGYSEISGGAILVGKNSSLLIDNCTFHSNKVHNSNGGAIYGLDGTDIEINNSELYNNTAERLSDLPWNVFKSGMGSAICMRIGSNLRLNNTIVRDHIGYVTTILIITWDDVNTNQSTLYVDNCLFENNTAWSNGAIYLDEFGIAEIKNSVFKKNNSTFMGGTVVFDASNQATVINCTFEENQAIAGGGVYINTFDEKYGSTVDLIDSTFIRNSAIENGGAILSKYSKTNIVNCIFNENSPAIDGGAIYSKTSSINITNSNFIKNSGKNGGAVYSKGNEIKIFNSTFNGNLGKKGGAVYSKDDEIIISNSAFNENSAENGGSLFLKSMENIVSSSSFVNNHAFLGGGAIHASSESTSIIGCIFNGNSGSNGGSLFLTSGKNIVSSSSFVNNHASKKGGAIYSKMNAVSSHDCVYSKNSAPKAANVYGGYYAKVTRYVSASGKVMFKVALTPIWKMPKSHKIQIKLTGIKTKWFKVNSKGIYTFVISKNKKIPKKLKIKLDQGVCVVKKYIIKDSGKISLPKNVKKSSKLSVSIKNSQTKKPVKKTNFIVKVFTGKKYKTLKVKTDSKGILKINMKKFSKGKHDISFYLSNKNYYINKMLSFKIN